MKTKDIDIRRALRGSEEIKKLYKEDPLTRVIEELGICRGQSRIDIAVLNGSFYGYEIKSDKDTLKRLPQQIIEYDKVFDYMTIVCGVVHVEKVKKMIPDWWGVIEALPNENKKVELKERRPRGVNKEQDPFTIAQLLWREEALGILVELGKDRGVRSKSCNFIWQRLSQVVPLPELKNKVRAILKSRKNWREDL